MGGRRAVAVVGAVAALGPCGALLSALGLDARWAFGAATLLAIAIAVVAARRLPGRLDELARAHRRTAIVWTVLALAGAANLARVSYFMADAECEKCSLFPQDEFVTSHNCLTAYFRAAQAVREHAPNVYDPSVYQGGDDDPPRTIGPFPIDLYEYPPQFLVPVRAALVVSDDFMAWRAAWFGLEVLLFGATLLLLAAWIGEAEGRGAALLAPAVLFAAPTVMLLQVGNYQLAVYALTILAMLAIERRRDGLGGALLALVTVTKLFPGLFLVYLLARRRYRAAVIMIFVSAAITVATAALLGLGPFHSFVSYQLPRMADGSAFPWLEGFLPAIATNHSIFGLVLKLHALGVPGMTFGVAGVVAWAYTLVAVAIAFVLGRGVMRDRLDEALVWLGLLQLAALRAPFAPDVYAVLGPIWIAALLAVRGHRVLLAVAWVAMSAGVLGLTVTRQMPDGLRLALTGAVQAIGFVLTFAALRRRVSS